MTINQRRILIIDDGYGSAHMYHELLRYRDYHLTQVMLTMLAHSSEQYERPCGYRVDGDFALQ